MTDVEQLLHARGLRHLRSRKHGSTIIVESGSKKDPAKHFRLRRDTVDLWCLDFADHRGIWEPTPERGHLDALVTMVMDQFPWTVSDVFDPEGTSGAEY